MCLRLANASSRQLVTVTVEVKDKKNLLESHFVNEEMLVKFIDTVDLKPERMRSVRHIHHELYRRMLKSQENWDLPLST